MSKRDPKAYPTFESFNQEINEVELDNLMDDPINVVYDENVTDLPDTVEEAYRKGLEDMYHYMLSKANDSEDEIEDFVEEEPGFPQPDVNEENSLKDLVGKADDEELDLDDARTIGKKISKMKGDDRKKYIGIVNFMGASCRIYNEIWANYKPVDPSKKKANKGKEYRGDKDIG